MNKNFIDQVKVGVWAFRVNSACRQALGLSIRPSGYRSNALHNAGADLKPQYILQKRHD
jgi:hypothetical protein